jgi:hypothetical protein
MRLSPLLTVNSSDPFLQKLVVISGTVETACRASVSAWNVDCESIIENRLKLFSQSPIDIPIQPSSSLHISVKETTLMIGCAKYYFVSKSSQVKVKRVCRPSFTQIPRYITAVIGCG